MYKLAHHDINFILHIEAFNLLSFSNFTVGVTAKGQVIKASSDLGSSAHQAGEVSCWVDGSFSEAGHGGVAHIAFSNNELLWYQSVHLQDPISAFQTEAEALLRSLQAAHSRQLEDCTFYMDCQLLVSAVERKKETAGCTGCGVEGVSYNGKNNCSDK